jgi:hypothetical protein
MNMNKKTKIGIGIAVAVLLVAGITVRRSSVNKTGDNGGESVPADLTGLTDSSSSPSVSEGSDQHASAGQAASAGTKSSKDTPSSVFGIFGGGSNGSTSAGVNAGTGSSAATVAGGAVGAGVVSGVGGVVATAPTANAGMGTASSALGSTNTAPAAPAPVTEGCEKVVFTTSLKGNHEMNVLHLNADLKKSKIRWESLCVRADGTPVEHRFDSKKMEISVSSLRKSPRELQVSYCFGNTKCEESCIVPRDEFLEALAGTTDLGDEDGGAGWGPEKGPGADMISREEQDLNRELASFGSAIGEEKKVKGLNDSWKESSKGATCQNKVAQLR